jgi:ribosomal protein S18 acetylase RimI-like enzyme
LAQLRERLAGSGARTLELRVNRHNAAAIGFYRKNGFTAFADDCREIGGGYVMDDYLMRRDLA